MEWVRGFVGYEFVWELELRVRNDSAPPARLEDKEKLGWSTWLGGAQAGAQVGVRAGAARLGGHTTSDAAEDYAIGMVFEPEEYVGRRQSNPFAASTSTVTSTTAASYSGHYSPVNAAVSQSI